MGSVTAGRRRLIAVIALAVVIVAGLGVHLLLPDTSASDIAGDALYAIAVYLLLVVLAPRLPPLAAGGIAAAWCVGIELFQLTGIPIAAGAVFPPTMLVLGTAFDARDLVVYVIAIAATMATDAIARTLIERGRDER